MKRFDISLLRILAMLMVTFTHCIDPYIFGNLNIWNFEIIQISKYRQIQMFIHAIDIPIFCFISGYLYEYMRCEYAKYSNTINFLIGKAKTLLIPYLFWYIFICIVFPERCSFKGIVYSIDHLWFLLMLMWCFTLASVTINFWEKSSLLLNIIAFILFSSLFALFNKFNLLTQLFCIDMFILYFPIFFLGILFAKYYVFDLLEKRVHTALYFAEFILSLIALFIFTHDNFSSYTLSRIIGMIITIFVGGYFYSIRQKLIFLNKPILKSLDENCIGIYLLHLIIILFLFKSNFVIQFMNQHTIIAPILLFLTSLLSSWGTSILIRKTSISIIIR